MYCVKCGKLAQSGEKRCAACGMRLVTPAKLRDLIELEKYVNMTFSGKLRNAFKKFKRRSKKRFAAMGQGLKAFFGKLKIDLMAFGSIAWRAIKFGAKKFGIFLRKAFLLIKKYFLILLKDLFRGLKALIQLAAQKIRDLREQYKVEREYQQSRYNEDIEERERKSSAKSRTGNTAKNRTTQSARQASTVRSGNSKSRAAGSNSRAYTQTASASRSAKSSKGERKPDRSALYRSEQTGRPRANSQPTGKSQPKRTSKKSRVKPFSREWAQEHMRSLVAMGLLVASLLIFVIWGSFTDSGQKTFASIGFGSARGYMLIGDDYMAERNYSRAVEYYYTSVNKELTYEAALKLAIAYSYTGDIENEVRALLICAEYYPENKQAFSQLYLLYPEGSSRPDRVQRAIENGLRLYGSL